MSGAFSQIYVQYIFAVGDLNSLIDKSWSSPLYKHIAAYLREKGHVPIIINGVHDHIHVFTTISPKISVDTLAEDIKNDAAEFIKQEGFIKKGFTWQSGYGAYSYSKIRTNDVYLYILHQDRFHAKRTFREEFIDFLRIAAIDYDPNELPKGFEEFSMVQEKG